VCSGNGTRAVSLRRSERRLVDDTGRRRKQNKVG
jgi:hypothetical protein